MKKALQTIDPFNFKFSLQNLDLNSEKSHAKTLDVIRQFYGSFLWTGFNCLKATEPRRRDSLFFAAKFSGDPGTYLIDLGRMKG